MLYTENYKGRDFAKDPAVVRFKNQLFLYYSNWHDDKLGISIAVSSDYENFKKISEVPQNDSFEKNGIGAPAAIVLGYKVHLFYQTYGNGSKDKLCHAVSEDGISFIKNKTNPIFAPTGDWNVGRAIDADVVVFKGRLLLYFATRTPDMKIQILGVASADINSEFGRDDFRQECNESILFPTLEWEQECIEAPATCVYNDKVYLFYGGAYNCHPQQIGCAVSTDGIHFTRVFDQPLLANGKKGEWNEGESGHPFLFTDIDGSYHLYYQGSADDKNWYLSYKKIAFKEDKPFIVE